MASHPYNASMITTAETIHKINVQTGNRVFRLATADIALLGPVNVGMENDGNSDVSASILDRNAVTIRLVITSIPSHQNY